MCRGQCPRPYIGPKRDAKNERDPFTNITFGSVYRLPSGAGDCAGCLNGHLAPGRAATRNS